MTTTQTEMTHASATGFDARAWAPVNASTPGRVDVTARLAAAVQGTQEELSYGEDSAALEESGNLEWLMFGEDTGH